MIRLFDDSKTRLRFVFLGALSKCKIPEVRYGTFGISAKYIFIKFT
jgi:hypothetical protein